MALSDYKSRREIAELGPIPYSTLKKLAMRNDGPPTIKIGDRVYYHVPSYEAWLASYLGQQSPATGEKPRKKRGRPTKAEQISRRRRATAAAAVADTL
jgi:hypothetical protein